MIKKSTLQIISLIFFSSLLFSCSKKDDDNKEAAVKSQEAKNELPRILAIKRWNALINSDWDTAYSFETPAYRKNYTVEDFKSSFGVAVTWKSIKHISTKDVSEKVKDVKVELTISFSEGGGSMLIPSMFDERWLLSNNQWWHAPQK